MTNPDAPPVPPESERHIVITVARTSPNPFDVDVYVDGGDLDCIALRAYLEVALVQLEAEPVGVTEDDDE